MAEDSAAFVQRVAELGLEGVVAKRLGSRYMPGRRSAAWIKMKLRRDEPLAVTGIRRTRDGRVDAIHVARRLRDGSLVSAGSVELGLASELVEVLEQRLLSCPPRRRGSTTWYRGELSITASLHGLPDRPVRNAILRGVLDA